MAHGRCLLTVSKTFLKYLCFLNIKGYRIQLTILLLTALDKFEVVNKSVIGEFKLSQIYVYNYL